MEPHAQTLRGIQAPNQRLAPESRPCPLEALATVVGDDSNEDSYDSANPGLFAPPLSRHRPHRPRTCDSNFMRARARPLAIASVRKSIPINDRRPRGGVVRPIPRACILWASHDSNPLSALRAVSTIVRLPVDRPLRLRDTVREIKLGCRILGCWRLQGQQNMISYLHMSIFDDVLQRDFQGGIAVDMSIRMVHSTT